jgi:hypothetical protein
MSGLQCLRTNYPAAGRTVDYESVKRNGFHDQGILVVPMDHDRLTWPEREFLRQIGEKLYGRRVDRGAA